MEKFAFLFKSDKIEEPFLISNEKFSSVLESKAPDLPNLAYPDIYQYLEHSVSSYTNQELKAYKSTKAYSYFVAGYISNVRCFKISNTSNYIVKSQVKHSQQYSKPCLKPWIGLASNGTVIAAHCTCMAGLGECCSHVAGTLFALESAVNIANSKSCTDIQQSWHNCLLPKALQFKRACEIDFGQPATKRRKEFVTPSPKSNSKTVKSVSTQVCDHPSTSSEKANKLHSALHAAGGNAVVLSAVDNYYNNFAPKSMLLQLPAPQSSLYKPEHLNMDYYSVIEMSHNILQSMNITNAQVLEIEKRTRQQFKSKLWQMQRSGRITASVVKACVVTNPCDPSVSLIKQICYREAYKFTNQATKYGIENEKKARSFYEKCMSKIYSNVSFDDAGFHIHLDFNYLGVTSDGFVSCSCCGSGIFEIKCPFSKRDSSIDEAIQNKKFYLQNKKGEIALMKNHAYYYQVQAQLFVSNKQYCDFICYTGREVRIEKINQDDTIRNCMDQIYSFYLLGVLPELVAKWPTVQRQRNNQVKVVLEFD